MKRPFIVILKFIAVLALAAAACSLSTPATPSQPGATIGGTISADLNGNGVADSGEGPLDSVIVSLSGCGENKTALTGINGSFQFDGLPSGICVLEVTKNGWTFSGSYPTPGYPIPVTADPTHPNTLLIYMQPSDQTQSAPAPDSPTASPAPANTSAPTAIPLTSTPEPTSTPSVPMVTALDQDVNCRFGPSLKYLSIDALLAGESAELIGRTSDNGWWQVDGPRYGNGKCFVGSNVTTVSGDISSVPVVSAPDAFVINVKVSISITKGLTCTSPHGLQISGIISTNGPAKVTYHWILSGPTNDTTPPETIQFTEAGDYAVSVTGGVSQCGNYTIKLQIDEPNTTYGSHKFSITIP